MQTAYTEPCETCPRAGPRRLQGTGTRTSRLWVRGSMPQRAKTPSGERRRVPVCVDKSMWLRDTRRYQKFWPERRGRKQTREGICIGTGIQQTVCRQQPSQRPQRPQRSNISTRRCSEVTGQKPRRKDPLHFYILATNYQKEY